MPGKQPASRKDPANYEKIAGDEFVVVSKVGLSLAETMSVLEVRPHALLVGFRWSRRIQQFNQARLVRIAHRRLPIWLHPLGMLNPQIVVDLS